MRAFEVRELGVVAVEPKPVEDASAKPIQKRAPRKKEDRRQLTGERTGRSASGEHEQPTLLAGAILHWPVLPIAAAGPLTKVIFNKLGVDAVEPNGAEVANHELADGIRRLVEVDKASRWLSSIFATTFEQAEEPEQQSGSIREDGAALSQVTEVDLLRRCLATVGVEPPWWS